MDSLTLEGRFPSRSVVAATGRPRVLVPRSPQPVPQAALPGDFPYAHQLLQAVLKGPNLAEFQAENDDPDYRPGDRLVVKDGRRVIAHLRLSRRNVRLAGETLPLGVLDQLVTAPEFHGRGLATALVEEGQRRLARDGMLAVTAETSIPGFFRRFDFATCGRHCYSVAAPEMVRAAVDDATPLTPWQELLAHRCPLTVRLFRRVELAALALCYENRVHWACGAADRNEDRWTWLIRRRACERILIVFTGEDELPFSQAEERILGYAAMRGPRIVELAVREGPHAELARKSLLWRACGDAIERDHYQVRYDGPPNDQVHAAFQLAGGSRCYAEADRGALRMLKLFDPIKALRRLKPVFARRGARALPLLADLNGDAAARPAPARPRLGLLLGGGIVTISLTDGAVETAARPPATGFLALDRSELARLVFGHFCAREAAAAGRISVSSETALTIAEHLFPKAPLYFPPWDDLESRPSVY